VSVFLGNQLAVPTQDRIGREQPAEFTDFLSSEFLPSGRYLLPAFLMSHFVPNCDCRDFGLFLAVVPNCCEDWRRCPGPTLWPMKTNLFQCRGPKYFRNIFVACAENRQMGRSGPAVSGTDGAL
jgi:hypothetical protein